MTGSGNRRGTIQGLVRQLRRLEQASPHSGHGGEIVSTGWAALDGLLPGGGLSPGTLVEWLGDGPGSGAGTAAWAVAANIVREEGVCVVIDERREYYPPGAARLAPALDRLIVVHPASGRDALWALEQSLRCSGVAVVVSWIERMEAHAYRRLQLAAEVGGGIGLLLRPAEYRSQSSWAGVRLLVKPLPASSRQPAEESSAVRRLRVELVHCRGRISGGTVELPLIDSIKGDDETGDVRTLPGLGDLADTRRAAGA